MYSAMADAIDFWRMAQRLGDSSSDISLDAPLPALSGRETDWSAFVQRLYDIPLTVLTQGDLELVLDDRRHLVSVNYGFAPGDHLLEIDRAPSSSRPHLALDGGAIARIATISEFAATMRDKGSFEMTGRSSDRWLRFSMAGRVGMLTFEFIRAPFTDPVTGKDSVDYGLYGISVTSLAHILRMDTLSQGSS